MLKSCIGKKTGAGVGGGYVHFFFMCQLFLDKKLVIELPLGTGTELVGVGNGRETYLYPCIL